MYQISELRKFPDFIHAFSTRDEGNMSFNWGEKDVVLKNRKEFLSKLEINPDDCVALAVQDKDELIIVDKNLSGRGMFDYENAIFADSIITREKGLYLFLCSADCLPIFFFDSKKRVIALTHASWKSTEAKIVFKTVKKLIAKFGCSIFDIYVVIGPGIRKESFKFKNPIQKQLPGWKPFLEDMSDGNTSIDLVGYNRKQLQDAGISSQNIFISDINTAEDSNFFSHYRESREDPKNEGRFACVVGLK